MSYFFARGDIVDIVLKILETPVICTIIGVIIGSILTYQINRRIFRRSEFSKAADQFREAFIPVRRMLDIRLNPEPTESRTVMDVIAASIEKQTEAMLRFSPHLSRKEKECFRAAWVEYTRYDVEGEPNTQFLQMYANPKWEGEDTRELAIRRIDKLLRFADPR